MITILLITGLIISLGVNIATIIIIRNFLQKEAVYQKWVIDCKESVEATLNHMRALDKQGVLATSLNDKGVFESDDQIGALFKEIEALIERLNQEIQ